MLVKESTVHRVGDDEHLLHARGEHTTTSSVRPLPASRTSIRTGLALTILVSLFLAFDAVIKVLQAAPAIDTTSQLGYPAEGVP